MHESQCLRDCGFAESRQAKSKPSKCDAEYQMRSERDGNECAGSVDVEDARVGSQQHRHLQTQRHYIGPHPVAPARVSGYADVHDAKGRAVAEMVHPADELSRERITRLLDGLAQDHCAETRENL